MDSCFVRGYADTSPYHFLLLDTSNSDSIHRTLHNPDFFTHFCFCLQSATASSAVCPVAMDLPNTTSLILFVFLFVAAMSQTNVDELFDLLVNKQNSSQTSGVLLPATDEEMFREQLLPKDGGPNCQCVEYYLCNPDSKIIINGEGGLIDPR